MIKISILDRSNLKEGNRILCVKRNGTQNKKR